MLNGNPSEPAYEMSAGPRDGTAVLRDHADALQVIIHAENAVQAYDSGYGPGRFLRRAALAGPERHNVLSADRVALGNPGATTAFLDTRGFAFEPTTLHKQSTIC